jgi:phosphate transport system protein
MFRKWLMLFKKDTLMNRAYQRSFEMLDITQAMFNGAKISLRQREDSEVDLGIKETDKKVNSYEREVRRMVLNHLVVSGNVDLPSGLILISIIIDIERIGDYAKNMVELAEGVSDNFMQAKKCFE